MRGMYGKRKESRLKRMFFEGREEERDKGKGRKAFGK
jgi:hypothetical protein